MGGSFWIILLKKKIAMVPYNYGKHPTFSVFEYGVKGIIEFNNYAGGKKVVSVLTLLRAFKIYL